MAIKSRVPNDLSNEDSMKTFLDSLDRKHIKTGNLTNLATTATATEIVATLNELLAIYREH